MLFRRVPRMRRLGAEGDAMRRSRGFSLIELLVVVSIVALLAGLLLPAISMVKESARKMVCATNLRQIGLAILAYANDNHGTFPQNDHASCSSWPYIFGDWGSGAWGGHSDFYTNYLPARRNTYYCPEGMTWQAGTGSDIDEGWKYFPGKPPTKWISCTNYCYFAGPNELGSNSRRGPRGVWAGTARSTLIADLMKFGQTDYTLVSTWNHLGGSPISGGNRLNGRSGGNMCYMDGHVAWMSDPSELLKHRQKMKGSDIKSYAAEQMNDP